MGGYANQLNQKLIRKNKSR